MNEAHRVVGAPGGRTWWAHLEFTRVNTTPTSSKMRSRRIRSSGQWKIFWPFLIASAVPRSLRPFPGVAETLSEFLRVAGRSVGALCRRPGRGQGLDRRVAGGLQHVRPPASLGQQTPAAYAVGACAGFVAGRGPAGRLLWPRPASAEIRMDSHYPCSGLGGQVSYTV